MYWPEQLRVVGSSVRSFSSGLERPCRRCSSNTSISVLVLHLEAFAWARTALFGGGSHGVNTPTGHGCAQSGFKVIPDGKEAISPRIKVIADGFYPIADHFEAIADGFYPIADRLKVIADGKKVIWVGFK